MLVDPRLECLLRWFLGLTFVVASFHKILAPAEFAKIVYGYALFPSVLINLIALLVPFLELVAGAALITGIYPRSAAAAISGMVVFFIASIGINLIRGHEFDCGCFSFNNARADDPTSLLLRDILYLATGVFVMCYDRRRIGCLLQTGSFFRNLPARRG